MRKFGLLVPALVIIVLLALPMGASAEPAQTAAGGSGCVQWYTIRCGDTLSKIAWRFGTTTGNLAAINGIWNPNYIVAGTTICVGSHWGPPPSPPPPSHKGFNYVVRCGDTLGNIGAKYGWSAFYLAKVNHLWNPNLIFVGQVLWIPGR